MLTWVDLSLSHITCWLNVVHWMSICVRCTLWWVRHLYFSVCNGMPIATILSLALVIKQSGCGMYKVESVFAFSLVTGVWFCLWQCHLMAGIWLLVMKMAQSWCGTSQVVAVLHLWLVTPHVCGPWLSGGCPFLGPEYRILSFLFYFNLFSFTYPSLLYASVVKVRCLHLGLLIAP